MAHERSDPWQAILSALYWGVLATLSEPEKRHRAEVLFSEAKQLVVEAEVRRLTQRGSRLKNHYTVSHAIERLLSEPEVGSTFHLTLRTQIAPVQQHPYSYLPASLIGKRVLLSG